MRAEKTLCALVLASAFGGTAMAALKTTSASGDWATNGNWVGGSYAFVGGSTSGAGTDSAIINGHAMTISGTYPGDWDPRSQTVTINGGGSVTETRGGTWVRVGDVQSGTVIINQGTLTNGSSDFRMGAGGGNGFLVVGDGAGVNDSTANLLGGGATFGGNMDRGSPGNATVTIASDGMLLSTGGTHNWGDTTGSIGTLNINGGTYSKSSGQLNVGNAGGGALNMTGGTLQKASGDIVFGNAGTGVGTLVMSGNSVINHVVNDFRFGLSGIAVGTMSGNAQIIHPPGNWFQMGQNATGSGTLTLDGNSKITTGGDSVKIGFAGRGVLTLNNTAQFLSTNPTTTYPNGNTTFGYNTTGTGTLNVSGGALFSSVQTIGVGEAGAGIINQTGGTVTSNDAITIGRGEGGAGRGTVNISGGTLSASLLTLGEGVGNTASTGIINQTGGIVQVGSQLRMSYSTNGRGTYNLEGGTLRVDNANLAFQTAGNGTFNWGGGVIAGHTPGVMNSAGGVTDYTLAPTPTGPVVRSGDTIAFTGNLTSGYLGGASRLDLGGLYLTSGTRTDIATISGTLNLAGAADVLEWNDSSVYLLRPFGAVAVDYGTIPLVTAGTLTGSFETFVGLTGDSRPWSQYTGVFSSAAALPDNTWFLQQTGTQMLFHYKVTGFVPEPGTFGLMGLGVLVARMVRRRGAADGDSVPVRRPRLERTGRSRR